MQSVNHASPWTLEIGGNGYCRIVCGRDAEGDLIPVTGDWLPETAAAELVAAHNGYAVADLSG